MMHLGRIGRQWSWLWVCIALLGCSRQEGRLILILDNSASMAQTGTHFEIIKESVVDALQLIPASYEVGLRVYTDGGSRLVAPYRKGLAQLQVALNSIAPQGGTYIGQSLLDASKDLLQADKASQLIFITDGEGVKSDIALAQAAKSNLARLGKDFQCDFILYSKRIDVIEETPIGKIADILDCRLIMPGEQLSADSLTMSLQRIISKNFYWLWIIISFLAYLILSLLSASLLFSFQYASGVMPRQARIMASSFFFILLVIITGVHAVWFFSWLYGFAWTMAILALVILAILSPILKKATNLMQKVLLMIHFKVLRWTFYLCLMLSAAGLAIANDDYIILLDQSKSMREKQPGNDTMGYDEADKAVKSSGAVRAIYDVVDLLKEGDYFALITFGNKAELFTSQVIEYKHERDLIKRQVGRMRFDDGRTDIPAALKEASAVLERLNTPQRRKILIMITDGINDPPPGSPFVTAEQQQKLYQQLKDSIRFSKWNVVLLGLGAHTNVGDIASQLGLPLGNTLVVNDYQSSDTIRGEIAGKVKQQRDARVELADKALIEKGLELQLRPRLLGGYSEQQTELTLKSTFPNPVKMQLQTQQPLIISGDAGLLVKPSVLELTLNPEQTVKLPLNVSYQSDRPQQGYREGTVTFQFVEGTTPFYPAAVGMRLILPGWWDAYGFWAVLAALAALILAALAGWYIYRAQAPEVRIAVLAGSRRLGEPLTLKRGESFSIANNEFVKKSVPASSLNCKTAATVKYLGRHRFEISADEAKILSDGKEYDHLTVNLDNLFDLKDKTGKTLPTVMFTKPDRAMEFLGTSPDVSPF